MDRSEASRAVASLTRSAPDAAFATGLALLRADYPETLLPAAETLFRRYPADARMAQLIGLAARAAGDGPLAYSAFARAAALAPRDPLIAHSHARAALEAGHRATELFLAARDLAPQDGSVLQGLAAALAAEGRSADAANFLTETVRANPLWIDGHRSLARINGQFGRDALASIENALAALPANADLHRLRIATLLEARRIAEAPAAIAAARRAIGDQAWLALYGGHVASELNALASADREFAATPPPANPDDAALLARHEIRAGRPHEAAKLIDAWLAGPGGDTLWPYASLAWRMTGDPRIEWLEGDGRLIGIYDLGPQIERIADLPTTLRALHTAQEAPLDQSVRGGTQTDGNLLLRAAPAVQALREIIMAAVASHIASLPPAREGHPTLIARRKPQRIAGSWSVRLKDAGFHADHVHSLGWLSSALYVALPDLTDQSSHAGWLSIGECRDLVPELKPLRLIEPKPGRLVLFPSTMWHGTRPFAAGERLTVAFDIARPRQD